jgi:hypothetical protein
MGYLTINTQSNRVVIISSVITRIFWPCAIPGRSHFHLFNKDTRELFMLCISCFVPVIYFLFVHRYSLFIYLCSYSLLSFIYFVHCSTFHSLCCSILFFFNSSAFIIHCALFKREKFNSDPELCSRYFDPAYNIIYMYKSINIIQQTAPTLS